MSSIWSRAAAQTVNPDIKDAWTPLGYEPTERQRVFHDLSSQRIHAILYGGAAGGGKSCALLMEAIHCAYNYPGMRIGCFRRTYSELNESFVSPLQQRWGYARALGAKWTQNDYSLKFPNGSVINFTYAESPKDASRILGGEYQLFCVDECTLTEAETLQHIEERLRSGRRDLPVIGIRFASNPGGISQTYFKKRFVDPSQRGAIQVFEDPDTHLKHSYIPAKLSDNPHVDRSYEKVLAAIPDPIRRKQMQEGDWSVASGMFFEQWSDIKHVIQEPFIIPDSWQRYCGIDYGIRDPWAVVWGAVDPNGRVWCYREIYKKGVDIHKQPEFILEAEENAEEEHVIRFADPSIWGNMGTHVSIADIYGQHGCGLLKATNHRPNGWSKVHHYLNDHAPACSIHQEMGWDACPLLHVFGTRCPMFVETIPALPRTDTKSDDAKTRNVADHMPDALRYMVSGIGAHASPVIYEDEVEQTLKQLNAPVPEGPPQQIIDPTRPPVPLVGGLFGGDIYYKRW